MFNKSEEEAVNKDGKQSPCEKDVRKADLFVNGKECGSGHENSWNIDKGGPSKIEKHQDQHSDK